MILPAQAGIDGTLELRTWRNEDAAGLIQAVRQSRRHLSPWMEFANRPPEAVADRMSRFDDWERGRLAGGDAMYGMFLAGRVVGGCGLHRRLAADGIEIGYWVHADFTRQGICTRAATILTDLAFTDDMIGRVEIHHDLANTASGAVPAKLGYRVVGDSPKPKLAPADSGIERRWRVTRAEWFAARS